MLKVTGKLIELKAPKGIKRLQLHYGSDKGWLVEFWVEGGILGSMRYISTSTFTIKGVFTAMLMVPKLSEKDYVYPKEWTENMVVNDVSKWTTEKYEHLMKNAVTEDPMLTELKSLNIQQ